MENIPRTFILLAGLLLVLMPVEKATAQTQNSQPPPDELSVKQARHAIVSATKYAFALPVVKGRHYFSVNPSSIVFTLDSLEFDLISNKNETTHFRVNLKTVEKISATCGDFCWLANALGNPYTIQNEVDSLQYSFIFGQNPYGKDRYYMCRDAWNTVDCRQSAGRFASALNSLHAYANLLPANWHPADPHDFHQQAAAWRGQTVKPPLPEEVRVRRLLAEDAVKNHKPVDALNFYEIGLQLYPTWPEGHFNAALIAAELGDFDTAIEHMQSYLELVPNASDAQAARDQLTIWQHKAGQ